MGSPVANWLVQNAAFIGVQLVIWGRTIWVADARQQFTHYTGTGQPVDNFDHFNHVHVEFTVDCANMRTPFFTQNNITPPNGAPTAQRYSSVTRQATTRIVSRPHPRFAQGGSMPLPETNPGGGDVVRSTGPNGQVTTAAGGAPASASPSNGTPANPQQQAANPNAPVAATSDQENQESVQEDSFSQLFKYYAQYEYLRQRYMQRQAGVTLKFNPYVVPGFPCVLLDSMRTRFHFVGYVQSITHSGMLTNGQGSMATQVSVVCARTMPEFLNDIRNDVYHFTARIMAAPAEPIPEIRQIIQDEAKAEEFYRRLFFGGQQQTVPTSFHFDQVLGYPRNLTIEDIQLVGDSVATVTARDQAVLAAARTQNTENAAPTANEQQPNAASPTASVQAGGVSSGGQSTVLENIDPNEDLAPKGIYSDAFDSHDTAMQLCARPVCTLAQYIRFWYNGRLLGDLIREGLVVGPIATYAYASVAETDVTGEGVGPDGRPIPLIGPSERVAAIYYDRIYHYRPGPGAFDPTSGDNLTPPSVEERGYTEPANPQGPFLPTSQTAGVAATFPETRADWDQVLLAYRNKVRNLLTPST